MNTPHLNPDLPGFDVMGSPCPFPLDAAGIRRLAVQLDPCIPWWIDRTKLPAVLQTLVSKPVPISWDALQHLLPPAQSLDS